MQSNTENSLKDERRVESRLDPSKQNEHQQLHHSIFIFLHSRILTADVKLLLHQLITSILQLFRCEDFLALG